MFKPLRSAHGERSAGHLQVLADEELMQLLYRGNADAFEVIYDRHADAAFSLAMRMCRQRALAEDVVQEAFLSLWRSGARYDRNRGSVRTWTLGIVHNRAIDALRRKAVRDRGIVDEEGIEERVPARERTELEFARRDEAREIREALQQLPERAEPRDRARILRRHDPPRDRREARDADRDDQGPDAARPREDAHRARRERSGGDAMSDEIYEGCGEDAAPYVLGALTEAEHSAFLAHLETCAACREEVASLQIVANTLPAAVPQHSAPTALRGRVMATVRTEAELRGASARPRRTGRRASAQRLSWRLAFTSAAATAAVVVLAVILLGGSSHTGTRVIRAEVSTPSASATLSVSSGHGTLSMARMPKTAPGRVYEVWIKRCGLPEADGRALHRQLARAPRPSACPAT